VIAPPARGPLSDAVLDALARDPASRATFPPVADADAREEDLQLALFLAYELHFDGLAGVEAAWEWQPDLLAFRRSLEAPFLGLARDAVAAMPEVPPGPIDRRLRHVLRADDGPSLSERLEASGTVERYRDFLIQRSAYQLREADPHSFGIPRLAGRAKAALVEIQADEYGGGDPAWMHASLFARAMRALGLDAEPGAYADRFAAGTLAWVNLMSLFGLHRGWRGALVGHLAAFEMTSCVPNRRYGNGLRRLGFGPEATTYFDEHVEADAVHEAIAANELAGSLVRAEPELEDDVVFGARALLWTERWFAEELCSAWDAAPSLARPSATVGPGSADAALAG
jgi:hypothetical protein